MIGLNFVGWTIIIGAIAVAALSVVVGDWVSRRWGK